MNKHDGGSTTTHGAYAPERRTKSVNETIAECDQAQAEQIRVWAERIQKNVHDLTKAGDSPSEAAHDLMQLSHEMKNVAFVVRTFTTDLLARLVEK